jgi:hypothetical protein
MLVFEDGMQFSWGRRGVEERDAGELLMRSRESGHALTHARGVLDERWVLETRKIMKM